MESSTIADSALRARKALITHLSGVGALSAESAVTYQPQRHLARRALSYLLSRDVVQMTEEGRYWLDEEGAERWRRENRTRTALIVGGAAAAVLGALALRRYRQTRS